MSLSAWGTGHHCSSLIVENALRTPCPERAHLVYVNEDGMRFGYCEIHAKEGLLERARHGWVLDLPTVEAAA